MNGRDRISGLEDVLLELSASVPGITSTTVFTADGFVLASLNDETIDHYETGLLISGMEKKIKALRNARQGYDVRRISMRCDKGETHYFPLTAGASLMLISESTSKSGIILLRIGKFIEKLRHVLEPGSEG